MKLSLGLFRSCVTTCQSQKMNRGPLAVVLGATGAGKSKLALDIAVRLNGEIISADSMQVYRGLDIVTNKVTPQEQAMCPHHLIGFLPPLEEYTIVDFKKHALEKIKEIQSRKRLPVICGGTNYYIEAVLWEYLIQTNDKFCDTSETTLKSTCANDNLDRRKKLEEMKSVDLHRTLMQIDPERAGMLHPNDKRKIVRSIEVFEQSGKKHSDLLKQQNIEENADGIGGPLMFPNTCLIYVDCDDEVLKNRTDRRVDKMIEKGLLQELEEFHSEYNKSRLEKGLCVDYEHGIFQSIGFKEFHQYLTTDIENEHEKQSMLNDSIERMKMSTWQYAKYQKKWIRKRIVNRANAVPVYPVDSTNPEMWDNQVLLPALEVLQRSLDWGVWVEGVDPSSSVFSFDPDTKFEKLEPITPHGSNRDHSPRVMNVCDACGGKVFITENQWQIHITSRKHKKTAARRHKKLETTVKILAEQEKRLRKERNDVDNNFDDGALQLDLFNNESFS